MHKKLKEKLSACLLLFWIFTSTLAAQAAGPPDNPMVNQAIANDPHKWLDFIGYYGEMSLLANALIMFIAVIDLLVLRRWLAAGIVFAVMLTTAVVGVAAPGVCELANSQWSQDDATRFNWVHGIEIVGLLCWIAWLVTPVAIAKFRKQTKKFFWCTIVGTLIGAFFPIGWVVAMHFAFYQAKESLPVE